MRIVLIGLAGAVSVGAIKVLLGERGVIGYILGVGVGLIVSALFPA